MQNIFSCFIITIKGKVVIILMYIFYNANPAKILVGDCVVRAISKATGMNWEDAYKELVFKGFEMYDMPNSNAVWETYLLENGFERFNLPTDCPKCYTVREFADEYNKGTYIVGTGTHAIAVIDGRYFDTFDTGDETISYFLRKEEKVEE